jgi:hypothetical protein
MASRGTAALSHRKPPSDGQSRENFPRYSLSLTPAGYALILLHLEPKRRRSHVNTPSVTNHSPYASPDTFNKPPHSNHQLHRDVFQWFPTYRHRHLLTHQHCLTTTTVSLLATRNNTIPPSNKKQKCLK